MEDDGRPVVAVRCDECAGRYRPRPIEQGTEGGGAEILIVCPSCLTETVSARVTPRGMALRERIREAREQGRTTTDPAFAALLDDFREEVERGQG